MRTWRRPWIWLLAIGIGILAACSGSPGDRVAGGVPPGGPTLPPPTVIGVPASKGISPFAEYRLSLTLDPAERRLSGIEQVTFPNHTGAELDEIVFRLYPNLPQYGGGMVIDAVQVDGKQATTTLRADDSSLAVALDRSLAPETSVDIELSFDVEIPTRDTGYSLFGKSQNIWSVPDAYPLLAVYGGSGWHEEIAPAHSDAVFAEAALYDVTLTLPPTLTVVTTGAVLDETLEADGQRSYHIVGGPLREFAWLASADYQVVETKEDDIALRSYYLPGDDEAGQAALKIAAAALRAYEEAFGPYPFQEMMVVEAPLLYYGMEFPGVNLLGLDLHREQRAQLEDRVVHEIAHQWWYSQVGSDQVNTPWLDEGLAEYSMVVYFEQVYGEAEANTLVNQRWLVPYQKAVDNGYDAVVNQPSTAFGWEYEVIVYEKAALFFNALDEELGDETFRAVLQTYADRYRWRIAEPDDFLRVAESVSGRDLDALYNRWILSKQ